MTQHNLILDYIKKHKSITPFEAYDKLGCTIFAQRFSRFVFGYFQNGNNHFKTKKERSR